jgi:hypothetical protein
MFYLVVRVRTFVICVYDHQQELIRNDLNITVDIWLVFFFFELVE